MTDSSLVSVLLPMYNGSAFVETAIQSIQSQTYQNWELIVIDDGSQDNSIDICKAMLKNDSRCKLISNVKNLGLAATMNWLVHVSSGVYLAIQEQDDFSLPDRLAVEVTLLDSRPDIGLVSGIAEWLDDSGKITAHFPGILDRGEQYPQVYADMVRFLYIEQCKIVNAGCMFRRSVLQCLPLSVFDEDAKMSIDWQFFLHLAHHWKIWGLNETVVRMNRGNIYGHLTSKKELQYKEARRCIQKMYQEYSSDISSPIDKSLYQKAMSTQLVIEGRNYSRLRGIISLVQALIYFPANKYAWVSLLDLIKKGILKLSSFFVRINFD